MQTKRCVRSRQCRIAQRSCSNASTADQPLAAPARQRRRTCAPAGWRSNGPSTAPSRLAPPRSSSVWSGLSGQPTFDESSSAAATSSRDAGRPPSDPASDEASTSQQDAASAALFCATAPSAEDTLKSIVQEVRDLKGNAADVQTKLAAVIARDPSASFRDASVRAAVAQLLNLREFRDLRAYSLNGANTQAQSGVDAPASLRSYVETALYSNEVRRVFNDLLKDGPTLRREAAARAAAAAAADEAARAAAAADDAPKGLWRVPAAVAALAASVLRNLKALLDALHGIFVTPLFVADASKWRTRDLEQYANVLRHDAPLQALLLERLNAVAPKRVIERCCSGQFASNAACEVELWKAMAKTKMIDHFKEGGPPPSPLPHSDMRQFLLTSLQRMAPQGPALAANADPLAPALQGNVGGAPSMPLHVRLDSLPASKSNPFLAIFQSVFSFLFTTCIIIALWVLGAAAESKLSGGELSSSLAAQSSSLGEKASSYAPKEYNKDVVPEASKKTFADVKGCAEAKEELMEVVEYLKNPQRFVRMGAKLPKGVLLTGPPGTGKTLLARAVAGEANVPFFYRAGSEFEEMYVGVGSRRVRALFQAAKKKAPCIIFIDEIDSIGSNRKQWDNHSRKTLNQMLTEMDGFEENTGVIIMAATNLPEVLDPALTRPGRFDRRVTVNVPDIKGREEILQYYLASKPLSGDVDVGVLARKTGGFSGAQLSNMVNEAALQAAKEGADALDLRLLDEARDKVMMGKERAITRTVENIERTAYHEAGHALVALWTPGADPLHKATINPRGDALGLTWQLSPQDEYSRSRKQLAASIDVCMGGQAAETIVYGVDDVGSGATSDLKHATELARHMVWHCGFSSEVGPVYIDDAASPEMRKMADSQVRTMLLSARQRVLSMLEARLPELRAVAEALIREETLSAEQILEICARTRLSEEAAAAFAAAPVTA